MAKNSQKKEHGFWLSFFLVVIVLISMLAIAVYYSIKHGPDVINNPVILSLAILASVGKLVSAFGIWFWKKWGLYLYVGSVAASMIAGFLITGLPFILAEFLPVAIIGFLVKDKYALFD